MQITFYDEKSSEPDHYTHMVDWPLVPRVGDKVALGEPDCFGVVTSVVFVGHSHVVEASVYYEGNSLDS
jgi:hypothetical protein